MRRREAIDPMLSTEVTPFYSWRPGTIMYDPTRNDTEALPVSRSIHLPGIAVNSESHHAFTKTPNEEIREFVEQVGRSGREGPGPEAGRGRSSSSCSPSGKTTRPFSRAAFRCLPLRSDVVFPQTVVPLVINRPSGIRLIDDCMIGERMVGLVSQLHPETDSPGMDDLYPDGLRGLDPQDAQVPRRLDADRLPGAVSGAAGRRWCRPSRT